MGQPPAKLVRSGAASPVRRVDIVLPRPPPPPPDKPRPSALPREVGAAPANEGGAAPTNEPGTVRSRIQQEEKGFELPKGFWSSLLVGVLCLASAMTVFFTVRGWIDAYRQEQEESKRAEAEFADRANHPLYYRELIEQYAEANDLDPALVAAVVLCESSFNPDARSYLGACGLMQIMPDTAQWIADTTGEPDFNQERLYEAELSIRMGTWYLNYLAKEFDWDVRKMVCGYHAGQGNVAAWLRNPEYSSDGITLEVIPDVDTAGYEARVQRAILAYEKYHFAEEAQEDTQ